MKKSCLFALVVTPSLLEDPNYILTTEYPAALEMNMKKLLIEAADTDAEMLEKMYEGIGGCVSSEDPEAVTARLRELLKDIALQENEDPVHNYLIGLAYLSGIDVEVDHERAVSLITGAAEAGIPEAYEKLVFMYRNGEGLDRDFNTAIRRQKEFVRCLQKTAGEEQRLTAYEKLASELLHLGEYQEEAGKLDEAEETFVTLNKCAEELERRGSGRFKEKKYTAGSKLGDICMAQGRLQEAWKPPARLPGRPA